MITRKEKIQISPVVKNDLMAIFELSNQKSVRAMSFNQERIKLAGHRVWFARKLRDKNAVIGVSTSEKYRGRGIATMLIKRAVSVATRRGLSRIDAFTKPENLGSQALFKKLGWAYRGREEVSGNKALKYSFKIKAKI